MRARLIEISLMIIDHNFHRVIEIFDWISFAIRWMFYSSNFILQTFVKCFIYQTRIDYIVDVILFFIFNDYRWRWKDDLIEHEILKIFSQQYDVKYRVNDHFFSKDRVYKSCLFFSKFWKTLSSYDRVFLTICRSKCSLLIITSNRQFDNLMQWFYER
jgi:hypothetical protein